MSMQYRDGRLVARGGELYHAAGIVSEHFTREWMRNNMASYDGAHLSSTAAAELVRVVLQAMNKRRLGEAAESIARHPDGRTARRYYSDALNKLQWLITAPPSDKPIEADATDDLPGDGWVTLYSAPWKVDGYR